LADAGIDMYDLVSSSKVVSGKFLKWKKNFLQINILDKNNTLNFDLKNYRNKVK
jgi:hypothetical protein